jgi:general secretion pathway protein H
MRVTWARAEAGRGAGFTLLELMVVIAIMASLTAAFPLALNRFVPARRVDAAARALLADIRLAQARSVNLDVVVRLVPRQHGYEMRDATGPTATSPPVEWRESTSLSLGAGDGSRTLLELRIYPDGSSSGGRFVIQDGTRRRDITVSELTGRARLEPAATREPAS